MIYKYTIANVNLRSDKSKEDNIITVIPIYSKVAVLELDDEWAKVRFNNEEGYVENDYLSDTMKNWANLSLRDWKSIYSNVITVIPEKSDVEVLKKEGDWSYIAYGNEMGYVFNYYLSQDGEVHDSLYYNSFYKDILEFVNINNIKSPTEYLLVTDVLNRLTYVFHKENKFWNEKFKWQCTVGKETTQTIIGIFDISGRKPGFGTKAYWVKYATRIKGPYYYHSILYNSTGEYIIDGRLGQALSHGCVRLATQNAKWIYDNIPDKTTVVIH